MRNIIKIHDKEFEVFIDEKAIYNAIINLSEKMNNDMAGKNPLFIIVLKGGFMFGSDLFKHLNIECELDFISLSSYDGMTSTQKVKELFEFNIKIKGRTIVIIEDVIDTGITMKYIIDKFNDEKAKEVKIATLLFKPDSFNENFKIDYIGFSIPNDFVVGYGLDYNGHGRNLKSIYKII